MTQTIGGRTAKISAVLAVIIMIVTKWTEPAPVNHYGLDRDVMSVRQDTGELIVDRDIVLAVKIMYVTMWMEFVPVYPH